MSGIPTYSPGELTQSQARIVGYGQEAVVSASPLAFASLANGQTFVTLDAAGASLSRTINAPLAASTTLSTFCAALAAQLNQDGTGYNWTATATTVAGTAKLPGMICNVAPTGTSLTGGVGSISTFGSDPIASGASTYGSTDQAYQAGKVCNLCNIHPRKLVSWYTAFDHSATPTGFTAQNATYGAEGAAVTVSTSAIGWASSNIRYFPGANFGDTKWAIGAKVKLVNATTEAAVYLHASAQDYLGVSVSQADGVRLIYGTGYNPAVAWGPSFTQVVPASALTGLGYHDLAIYSRGNGTFFVEFDGVIYGSFSVTQLSTWGASGSALGMVRDSGGTCSIVWGALWFMGDFRGWR